MTCDNVLPIDEQSARLLAHRKARFGWFVAALTLCWLAAFVPALVLTPLPPLGMLAALGALMIAAEHRFILYGDETSMSASIIVALGAVPIFLDSSPLLGPLLVASLGGLYFPHVRDKWGLLKATANMAIMGLSALLAAAAATAWPLANRPTGGLAVVALTSLMGATYWVSNNLLVAAYQVVVLRADFLPSARRLLLSETDALFWAAAAAFGALLITDNPAIQLVFISCMVLARIAAPGLLHYANRHLSSSVRARLVRVGESLLALGVLGYSGSLSPVSISVITAAVAIEPAGSSEITRSWRHASIVVLVAASQSDPHVAVAMALGAFLILRRQRGSRARWGPCWMLGCALSSLLVASAGETPLAAWALMLIAATSVVAITVIVDGLITARSMKRRDIWLLAGLVTPTRAQLFCVVAAVLVGTVAMADTICAVLVLLVLLARPSLAEPASSLESSVAVSRETQ